MNVPSVFQKAVDGFIIPPRTFTQMIVSAARGAFGLLNEDTRTEFLKTLDQGTIDEAVISQASGGPMMMLSLFHDLQNPLFKRTDFEATEFLQGAGPALERFHNVSGALENQLQAIRKKAEEESIQQSSATATEGQESTEDDAKDDENASPTTISDLPFFSAETTDESIAAVLKHEWMDDAKKDPESLAGQLSRMVTQELFQVHQVSAKTAFLLQSQAPKVIFKEGSCTVNNVALLSARSFLCIEREPLENLEEWGERSASKYEIIDYDMTEHDMKKKKGGIAAQVEVLYDVTQTFEKEEPEEDEDRTIETNIVSVAVMEAWLNGGPEGELRWRLALHRPALEFPGIQ